MDIRTAITLVEGLSTIPEDAGTPVSAFDRWFAGSEFVDAAGKPLVLYHGTSKDQDFRAFKMPKNGIWFTIDRNSASEYALDNDSKGVKYDSWTRTYSDQHTASRVIPVYVKATKVMYYSGIPAEINVDNYKRAQGILFGKLRMQGYDAVCFDHSVYVVIGSPNQIKSAIGNKGSSDPAKKNIDEGGEQQLSEMAIDTFRNRRGHTVELFKNPTAKEFKVAMGAHQDAPRAFLVDNDMIVWEATGALHQEIRQHLSLSKDVIPLMLYGEPRRGVDAKVTDNSERTVWWHNPEVYNEVANHPALKKLFGDVEVSYYDEDVYGAWTNLEDEDLDESAINEEENFSQPEDRVRLYHGTNDIMAMEIEKYGFQAIGGEGTYSLFKDLAGRVVDNLNGSALQELRRQASGYRTPTIFFTPSPEIARDHAKEHARDGGEIGWEISSILRNEMGIDTDLFADAKPVVITVEIPRAWVSGEIKPNQYEVAIHRDEIAPVFVVSVDPA